MIYELRTYTLIPGKQPQYLTLNSEVGRKVRGDKYGKFEGGWTTEFGTINQYVHLWGYADLEERNRLRAELARNDEWTKGYIPQIRPLLLAQETKILSAALPLQPPKDTGNIYELRWYRTQVGRAGEWLDLFKAVMPTREKYMRRVGLWRSQRAHDLAGQARPGSGVAEVHRRQRATPRAHAGHRPRANTGVTDGLSRHGCRGAEDRRDRLRGQRAPRDEHGAAAPVRSRRLPRPPRPRGRNRRRRGRRHRLSPPLPREAR